MSELCVDAEHARPANLCLVDIISVNQGWNIETAEVPNSVEDVIEDAANDVSGEGGYT